MRPSFLHSDCNPPTCENDTIVKIDQLLNNAYQTTPPPPPPPHLPSRAEPKQPVDSRNRFPNPLRMNPTKYEYLLDPTQTKTFERPSEKRCRA